MKFKEIFEDKKLRKPFWTYIGTFVAAIVFTIMVAFVDRQPVGPEEGMVGFASINSAFHNTFGYCDWLYKLTEYAGYISALTACFYAGLGLVQLIQRKSIKKVDSALIILACFYVLVGITYFAFELLSINCRPVILDEIEASYPSSHTFLTVALCVSTLLVNSIVYKNEGWSRWMNAFAIVLLIFIPLGRLFSGVHWLTDIIGGYLIGASLVALLNLAFKACIKPKTKKEALS